MLDNRVVGRGVLRFSSGAAVDRAQGYRDHGREPLGGKQKAHAGHQAFYQLSTLSLLPARPSRFRVVPGFGSSRSSTVPSRGRLTKLAAKRRAPSSKNPVTLPFPSPRDCRDRVKLSQVIAKLSANSTAPQHALDIAAEPKQVAGTLRRSSRSFARRTR